MSPSGDARSDLLVRARSALLDALTALADHPDAVVVIGAQAVYLRTGSLQVALAETTKDSDLALDPERWGHDPLIEVAMKAAGFLPSDQPGGWITPAGIPVDLMVPEQLAGPGSASTRGARIPPHDRRATRRARGLEATLIDRAELEIASLDPDDPRIIRALVAGPAALLVAKLHKIAERTATPHRMNDKDAHDSYRILRAVETPDLAQAFRTLLATSLSIDTTREAIGYLRSLFGTPEALGAVMAGRAELGVGDPDQVTVAVSLLADDLLTALGEN